MESVAIIGTGIAGMSCAYRIHKHVNLTVYESESQPGGHTHTVDISDDKKTIPVDTGFMVYNETTYPLLTQLFSELKVETFETDMSFGVQYVPDGIEYCGSGLNKLFTQRRNVVRPKFIRMIRDILRFNKLAVSALGDPEILELTLEGFIQKHGFSRIFMDYYLVPMTSAIWSTPPDEMLRFPAHTLIRFLYNHGLLGVDTHHQWRTVKDGSRQYRDKLIAPFLDRIRCNAPVVSVRRDETGAWVKDSTGHEQYFDKVVMATHADTTLKILANPTGKERQILGSFIYGKNKITLHTDPAVLPTNSRAWASWNYRIDEVDGGARQASTHYWMNSLQQLDTEKTVVVSVNEPDIVERETVFKEFVFDHPMFSKQSVDAQFELPLLNENQKLYYCGSYFRYGFHEDGILSGYAAADRLLTHSAAHAKLAI